MSHQIRVGTLRQNYASPENNRTANNRRPNNIRRRDARTLAPIRRNMNGNRGDLQNLDNNPGGVQAQTQHNSIANRSQHRGAYTVVAPDEKKRREMLENAQREEKNYEQHRAMTRPGRVSYSGIVGGPAPDQSQIRREQQIAHNRVKTKTWRNIAEHKKEQKRFDNEQNEIKKREARRKAERLEKAELERTARLREDHRRTNAAFLDKLERQTKNKS